MFKDITKMNKSKKNVIKYLVIVVFIRRRDKKSSVTLCMTKLE